MSRKPIFIPLFALNLSFASSGAFAQSEPMPNFESQWCKDNKNKMPDFEKVKTELTHPMNDFALTLWKKAEKKEANAVMSPWSLYTVISMAMAGAKGTTASGIAKTLGLKSAPSTEWYHLSKGVLFRLLCPNEYVLTKLSVANGLFVQKGKGLVPGYLALVKEAFEAYPTELDFLHDPEGSRKKINSWVSDTTQKKIPELLAKGAIKESIRLVLANAVFIKGGWNLEFPKERTKDKDFFLEPKKKVKVKMMRVEGSAYSFGYAKAANFQAVSMPTNDHTVDLVVILPDAVDGLKGVEKSLTGKSLSSLFGKLEQKKVNLSLPKFDGQENWDLVGTLKSMGMEQAFIAQSADFSGIDKGEDLLFVGDVAHKAVVKVNEEGFEGAAASAMMMAAGSAAPPPSKPIEVVVDRPFLYVIKDSATGAIIFIGRVKDPRAK